MNTEVPDQVLLWVMRDGTTITVLGSVHGTGVIYLSWDPERSNRHVNRSHDEGSEKLADKWLENATEMLARTGSVFVFRPSVVEMAAHKGDRGGRGFWVETELRRYVEAELAEYEKRTLT